MTPVRNVEEEKRTQRGSIKSDECNLFKLLYDAVADKFNVAARFQHFLHHIVDGVFDVKRTVRLKSSLEILPGSAPW